MEASESQTVRVQKIFPSSRKTETPRFPGAALACRAERMACTKNAGRKRLDRTRRRVIEMKGTYSSAAVGQRSRSVSPNISVPYNIWNLDVVAESTPPAHSIAPSAAKMHLTRRVGRTRIKSSHGARYLIPRDRTSAPQLNDAVTHLVTANSCCEGHVKVRFAA
jgi:hypothetical protein